MGNYNIDSISGITGSFTITELSVPIYYSILLANHDWNFDIDLTDWQYFTDFIRNCFREVMEINN